MNSQQFYSFHLQTKQMKESYVRSKVELKPLKNQDISSSRVKQKITDYEQYKDQPQSYSQNRKGNLADLYDWSKPSQIVDTNRRGQEQEQEVLQNHSMNTEELLRSQQSHGSPRNRNANQDLDSQIEIQMNPMPSEQYSYLNKIKSYYGQEYKNISVTDLQGQLKQMRQRIVEMNVKLNGLLDRYELLVGTLPPKQVRISNPYKFLSRQIELNDKIIINQQMEIKQIEQKDKQLEEKDYLIELNELIIEIEKQIHDLTKEKHMKQVECDKKDKNLLGYFDLQEKDQYKQVKILKHNIVFYFKKFSEQKIIQERLDEQLQTMKMKVHKITQHFDEMTKIAFTQCLEVTVNKAYLDLKRKYDQLGANVELNRKRRQITMRNIQMSEQKIEKEVISLKKEIQLTQRLTKQFQQKSQELQSMTAELIAKNHIQDKQIKPLSYRFDRSLIYSSKKLQHSIKKLKPDFRRISSRLDDKNTLDLTEQIDATQKLTHKKYLSINDKNIVTDEATDNIEQNRSSRQKMKPMLKLLKSKVEKNNSRYTTDKEVQKYKTLETSNIYKPTFLIKSKK